MQPGAFFRPLRVLVIHAPFVCAIAGCAVILAGLVWVSTAAGASLDLPLIHGLRDRGLYEYAIFEIDRLKVQPNLPEDMKVTLEFERAVTQGQLARSLVNSVAQSKELDRAAKSFAEFSRLHPDDPLAMKAESAHAQILLDRGRVEIWRLLPDDPPAKRQAAQLKARQLIGEARTAFQKAHDRAKAAFNKFPIAAVANPAARKARVAAETAYLWAQLNLAICTFEEALTRDPRSSERKQQLEKAANEFEAMHVRYRQQGAGLRARLWEGKCFQENGDLRKAEGIYTELLRNGDENETVRQIKDHATQFRLECLNDPSKKDYALVINQATQWLAAAKDHKRTPTGLGILWQRAVAGGRMAAAQDVDPGDRERSLRAATTDAQEVSRYPGEYQVLALTMAARLSSEHGARSGDSRSFASGFAIARKDMDEIQALNERLDSSGPQDKAKMERELHEQLIQTARRLRGVLAAADTRTNPRDLNQARYFLAFAEYELKHNDEALILADYAARRLRTLNTDLSRESARLALAAIDQEFATRSDSQLTAMTRIAQPVAEFLIHNWPDHERANEARVVFARMLARAKRHLEAARWYASVTEGSEQFPEAQIGAGREYWIASQSAPKQGGDEKSRESQINELTAQADKFLKNGIKGAGDQTDSAGNPPDWLTVGKTTLANLDIGLGRYDDAAKLLTDPPHSVVASVAVTDEATRQNDGVKGRPFASFVFQTLLRAQIGRHKIDDALVAMQQLEKIAGATGGEGVTAIYVNLGKEIEKEIARLIASNDRKRLTEVRKSFERFLEELSRRSDSMSYGSLLWVAETYSGLGEGMSADPDAAGIYFAKAANTYERLTEKIASDQTPLGKERSLSLQLRMANCLRRQGEYEQALSKVRSVIAARPRALDVQLTAAGILQDWGASGAEGSGKRSMEAIHGLRDTASGVGAVWGWADIAAKLQRHLTNKGNNDFREQYFEARYNIPASRRYAALAQKDTATRSKALEVALGEINAFARVSADVDDDSWRRLDTLYRQVEADLGRPATPLRKPDLRLAGANEPAQPDEHVDAKAGTAGAPAAASPGKTDQSVPAQHISPLLAGVGLLIAGLATAAAIVWNLRRQRSSRTTIHTLGSPDFVDLPARTEKPTRAAGSILSTPSSPLPNLPGPNLPGPKLPGPKLPGRNSSVATGTSATARKSSSAPKQSPKHRQP